MPVSAILRFEVDKNAECHVVKLKDSVWLDESVSFERLRIYLQVTKGTISGLRLIVPSDSVEFFRDAPHVAKLPQEKSFMRTDVRDDYASIEFKGATRSYDRNHTEIILLFPETLGKGKYLLLFDLVVGGYKKSDILTFLLQGIRWTYRSESYGNLISEEDSTFMVICNRIETWIVPPLYKRFWGIEPDVSVVRYVEMNKKAISILQGEYLVPNAGPVGRLAFQWEERGDFGYVGTPSVISQIKCRSAVNPLVSILAVWAFLSTMVLLTIVLP